LKGKHIEYLRNIFKETIEEMGGILEEFDGEADHVHLLIQYPPKWSISKIVNNLKGRSSRLLRRDIGARQVFGTGHILQEVLVVLHLKL